MENPSTVKSQAVCVGPRGRVALTMVNPEDRCQTTRAYCSVLTVPPMKSLMPNSAPKYSDGYLSEHNRQHNRSAARVGVITRLGVNTKLLVQIYYMGAKR